MTKRERIIQIVGFNIEPERAELMADEIIALFEPKYKVCKPYGDLLDDISYIEMQMQEDSIIKINIPNKIKIT